MITNWLKYIFWNPFRAFCYVFPLVPLKIKVQEVRPGIKLLNISNFATRVLAKFAGGFDYAVFYIIDNELVFDTGFSWSARSLKKYFRDHPELQIKYIINSHEHEDHTGNNIVFKDAYPQSKIYAHANALKEILHPRAKLFYRGFLFGPEKEIMAEKIPHSFKLNSGRDLTVIETPGHTPGHIVLYDPQNKVLFSGDLFIAETLDTQLSEANGPQWIESLERVLKFDIELVLDGHGVLLKDTDCKSMLEKKITFLKLLRAKTHEILSLGPIKESELIEKIFKEPSFINFLSMNEGWMSIITDGDFSRSNLIRSFIHEYIEQ